MASLVHQLRKEGLTLARPRGQDTPRIEQTVAFQESEESASECETEHDSSRSESTPNFEESASETESEDENYTMVKAKSILKTPTPTKKKRSANVLEDSFANMDINGVVTGQTMKGCIPFPMLSGRWEDFYHDTESVEGQVCMRMLLHNGTSVDDFDFSWVDEMTFKIRVKWPTFMMKCLTMTSLDMIADPTAVMGGTNTIERFPKTHRLNDSMGLNATKLKDEDRNIWAEGIFTFDKRMDTTKYEEKLFEADIGNNDKATILQIVFAEEVQHVKKAKKRGTPIHKRSSAIKFGKSTRRGRT